MTEQVVLVVEDNPITRRTMRRYLEAESLCVVEASDGRTALARAAAACPAVIIQDLHLPDMDGYTLLERLRAVPDVARIPIIAVTGHLPDHATGDAGTVQFNEVLLKPVESSRVIRVVKALLLGHAETARSGRRRALLAEDDVVQRKLLRLHLGHWGFDVTDVTNGADALRVALASPPDVVVSDLLMPEMDGLSLCLALRREPSLVAVPIVLVSSHHIDEIDHSLAARSGAVAVVPRTHDMAELEKVLGGLAHRNRATGTRPMRDRSTRENVDRLVGQIKREADVREELFQSQAAVSALLPFFERFSDLGAGDHVEQGDGHKTIDLLLAGYLDAAGAALGCAFLATPSGLVLGGQLGYHGPATAELPTFFGRIDLLERALERGTALELPSQHVRCPDIDAFLQRAKASSMILVPLVLRGERLGVLTLDSPRRSRVAEPLRVAEAVRGPITQALALSRRVAELVTSRQAFRGIVDSTSDGIVVADASATITYANPAALEIFGYAAADLAGQAIHQLMPFLDGAPESRNGTALRKDGATFPTAITATVYEDAPGHVLHAYLVRDLSLRATLDQLAALANRDGLTELFNRRRFDEHVASRIAEAIRYKFSGAIVLLDLDGFKLINDSHGHPAGDAVLRAVAGVLRTGTRTSDFVARLGGDEFAVELPHIHLDDAVMVANKLVQAVRSPIDWGGQSLGVGMSAGVAMYPQDGKTLEQLVHAADAALYRAKVAGKNRVCMSDGNGAAA